MKKIFRKVSMFLLMMSIPVSLSLTSCTEDSKFDSDSNTVPGSDTIPESKEKYNIILITTDQEAYMPTFPQESNYEASICIRAE